MIQAITLHLQDGHTLNWDFQFSLQGTMQLSSIGVVGVPEWVKLGFYKCPRCTLDAERNPTCPVAEVLAEYAHELANHKSYEKVKVEIYQTDSAKLELENIPLQNVVGELVRLGVFQYQCPIGRKVKPAMIKLAPFPTNDEIMEALAEGFAEWQAAEDEELGQEASELLESLHDLFGNLSKRLNEVGEGDAHLNGVVILHSLSVLFSLSAPEMIKNALEGEENGQGTEENSSNNADAGEVSSSENS